MKRILAVFAALLLLSGASIEPQIKQDARLTVVPLVFDYTVTNDTGASYTTKEAYCSAVKISPLFLVTAAHCLDTTDDQGNALPDLGREMIYKDVDGAYKVAISAKIDRQFDLLLLRVHSVCPCAPLAEQMPMRDADVMAIGYPMGPFLNSVQVLTEGTMQAILDDTGMLVTSPVTHGNSGGGLFNADGELAGIMVQIVVAGGGPFSPYVEVNHLALAVRTDVMRHFLDGF